MNAHNPRYVVPEKLRKMEPPHGGTWEGEWELRQTLTWAPRKRKARSGQMWYREYLEHDGHEECCHHTGFVVRDPRVVSDD